MNLSTYPNRSNSNVKLVTDYQADSKFNIPASKFSDGFSNVQVELSRVHVNPFKTFWDWYRMTWISLQNVEYDFDEPSIKQACYDVLNRRALPTPMETVEVEFVVRGLSRVALAQITRGRVGWAYNVESQMPQHIDHNVTIPKSITKDPVLFEKALKLSALSQELYNEIYDAGIPPQDARYMVLHGQQTSLMCHTNVAALFGYYARRCENGLTDELNLVGRLLKRELIRATEGDKGWEAILEKFDAMGADKRCFNVDKVFGNTGRSPSGSDYVPSLIGEGEQRADYDFSKSAWFLELLELPEDLLFAGEKEMIADWKAIGFEGRLQKLVS